MRGLPARWSGTEGVTPLPGVPVCRGVRGSALVPATGTAPGTRERRDVRGGYTRFYRVAALRSDATGVKSTAQGAPPLPLSHTGDTEDGT